MKRRRSRRKPLAVMRAKSKQNRRLMKRRKMTIYQTFFILSTCLFLQVNCRGQQVYQVKKDNSISQMMEEDRKIIITTAENLIAEFTKDAESATEKYTGKIIQITGKLFYKASPKDNIPETNASYIVFGDWKNGVYIQCYFDEVVVFGLTIGDTITVAGNFVKFQNTEKMKGVFFEKGIVQKTASKMQ